MINTDHPWFRPISWEAAPDDMTFFPHGITPTRYLFAAEKRHLAEWCEEHVGRQAVIGSRYRAAWMRYTNEDSYHFKKEADMVMFVLTNIELFLPHN